MTFKEKKEKLDELWKQLCNAYSDYSEMGSCNKDYSRYLVPNGTESEVTYHGKPLNSFRISDHWNWISPRKAPGEIQCPLWSERNFPAKTKPLTRIGIFVFDGKYYCFVCGERKIKHEWIWDCPDNIHVLMDRANRFMKTKEN